MLRLFILFYYYYKFKNDVINYYHKLGSKMNQYFCEEQSGCFGKRIYFLILAPFLITICILLLPLLAYVYPIPACASIRDLPFMYTNFICYLNGFFYFLGLAAIILMIYYTYKLIRVYQDRLNNNDAAPANINNDLI